MGEEWGDLSYGLVDYSEIMSTKRRAKYAYQYPVLRTATIGFKHLSQGEAWGGLQDAQRQAGLVGEFIIADGRPAYHIISSKNCVDSNWFSRAFLANFTQLDGLTNPYLAAYAYSLSGEEVAR